MKTRFFYLIVCTFLSAPLLAQTEQPEEIVGHVFKPEKVEATSERVQQITVPEGFQISQYATGLGKPRMMAVTDQGNVYVTTRAGEVLLLKDENKDGQADQPQTVLTLDQVHGVATQEDWLYLVTVKDVFRAKMNENGELEQPDTIITGLPDGGQHPNRTIEFGPDGKLYISVGSTCNACDETSEESATLLVADADGKNREIYAKGLRNTIGFAWEPTTQKLYGMDHGIDWLGDEEQKEELNQLEKGNDYGWPYIYGEGKHNPADEPPGDTTYEEYAKKVTNPVMTFEAHSSPLDMIFYTGDQFPEEYKNDAFVTFHGSWNKEKPSGYKVIRINFENGEPIDSSDLITGFLVDNNKSQFGRVTGLAVLPDGSLLISDDENGVIYRLSYQVSDKI